MAVRGEKEFDLITHQASGKDHTLLLTARCSNKARPLQNEDMEKGESGRRRLSRASSLTQLGQSIPIPSGSAEHSIAVGLPNPSHFDTHFCYACNRLTLNRTKVKNHSNCKGRGPVGKDLEAPFSKRKGCSLWAEPEFENTCKPRAALLEEVPFHVSVWSLRRAVNSEQKNVFDLQCKCCILETAMWG